MGIQGILDCVLKQLSNVSTILPMQQELRDGSAISGILSWVGRFISILFAGFGVVVTWSLHVQS